MRERRRIALLDRQIMLARIARREAMADLAGTLATEAKSSALARRSHELLHGYGTRADFADGQALRDVMALSSGLARLSADAQRAQGDARKQAERLADRLAGTDNRLGRLEDHARDARRMLERARSDREDRPAPRMAQKLLNRERSQSGTKP